MRHSLLRAVCALAVMCCLALPFGTAAQVPPSQANAERVTQEQERQISQPLNNAPIWKEVRSGAPQTTTVRGRETDVLIQSQGQTWRALRAPVLFWGGMLVALAILALAVFYLIRGPLDVPEGEKRGGRLIERFPPMDRYAHWLLAITWVTLAITGLILSLGKAVLLPLIGYTLFSWLATLAKSLHNFIGPILIVAVPLLFIRFVRDNGVGIDDIKWFLNLRGYFTGHEHPSGRFNAGEKVEFWFGLVILSTTLIVSGLVLVFPNFDQTRSTMQIASVVHVVAAYIAILLALVHIYLGTIGMIDAYRAMRYGYVNESWAKHHHLRWYEDVVKGRAREKFADADTEPEAAPAAAAARTRPA